MPRFETSCTDSILDMALLEAKVQVEPFAEEHETGKRKPKELWRLIEDWD